MYSLSNDGFHYQQVMSALNNDKHVYVEKPICLKKNEIIDIYNLLKKKTEFKTFIKYGFTYLSIVF